MKSISLSVLTAKRSNRLLAAVLIAFMAVSLYAQIPVSVGAGSYASYAPLSQSRSELHGGCQAYQMEHRRLYLPDSLLARLGAPDGSRQGTLALPTNDWWTYALVNDWTGKIWFYPGWAEAKDGELQIGYPTYWEPTGCEVKWDTPLSVSFTNAATGKKAAFQEALVDSWSDFAMSFIMQDGDAWVRVTCMHGSPLVWIEGSGITMQAANPDTTLYAVFSQANLMSIALLTEGLTAEDVAPYAFRIPRQTTFSYAYDAATSSLSTTFKVYTTNDPSAISNHPSVLMGFLPHHYYSNNSLPSGEGWGGATYLSPRGEMRLLKGNDFTFTYPVHPMLPFFPAPMEWREGFSAERMAQLNADYAARGTFGGDTYWGGKGLTQMAHYMTFALQMGDTATFRMAKQRLKEVLIDWYTYTPGEQRFYFARYPRWGALIGFDTSYDSDTFNDHHFHYGYFVYASAILCMLDDDFRTQYGAMAREVARDYANWQRSADQPWFRTLDPYCGHSFAGGLGNGGNGNGQESTSEAIQGWGGVYMLGAALQDKEMLKAGIMGYTLETRATAEYWFDRQRRNIDYTKYQHPYCCNLTMQGVGWWTWFSGDPVWMHSIQWLPISPVLTNHFCEDLAFTRWDYTEMYSHKEVGDYESASGGLGDESGLGNVCLSYLSLFDADSAARVWDRMDRMGKPLAKNPDTGGITYWLAHSHRALGEKRYDIFADHPLACVYTDTLSGQNTYAVYNAGNAPLTVRFFSHHHSAFSNQQSIDTTLTVPHGLTLVSGTRQQHVTTIADEQTITPKDSMAWNLPYPNLALHQPVTVSSYENAGCVAANLTDGDPATRWGSAHHDNEWAMVDLGEQCYIDHLVLRWEAAYASRYELALSNDLSSWQTVERPSSGGVERIQFPITNQQSAITHSRARYIRIKGIERATSYGTSLYELEAYGRPLQGVPGKLFVLALAASDTVVMQGGATTITSRAYDVAGNLIPVNAQLSVVSGEAQLIGNRLQCDHYGEIVVKGTVGDVAALLTIIVLETEQPAGLIVQPEEVTLPLGETQTFTVSLINQFGLPTDTCQSVFRATQVGDTTVLFDCFNHEATALVHVKNYSEVNLALHQPATASGSENEGTNASRAVDGDQTTRWSSRFRDNEWIAVDLQDCYLLTTLRLFWENAYAESYDVEISQDGETYQLLRSVSDAKGGVQTIDLRTETGEAVEAQFVRILCKTRNTGYGASLWEIEIYGESRCSPTDDRSPVTTPPSPIIKFLRNGQLYLKYSKTMYNVQGSRVR